ncbi:MAG: LamG domain-containing protein [Sedimentisphaerales bacterium]|nr:LamG domain-containing protein [Sedimentisphaerales bacterium]
MKNDKLINSKFLVLMILYVCFALSAISQADIQDGLVGYWPMDEASGDSVVDNSTYGNDGLLHNNPSRVSGQTGFGNAVDFDGSNDYINCGDDVSLRPTSAVTVSAWIKLDNYTYYAGIAGWVHDTGSTEAGYVLHTRAGGDLSWGVKADGGFIYFGVAGNPTGQWIHLVGTYNGSQQILYINGNAHTTSNSGNIDWNPLGTDGFEIGRYNDDNETHYLDGTIDEVAVWNRALSQTEVNYLYNNSPIGGVPAVIVVESDDTTEVTEGDAADNYTLVLKTAPSMNVDVTVTPGDTEITITSGAQGPTSSPIILTFTPANWDTAQTVSVTADDDEEYEGKTPHETIILHTLTTEDEDYTGLSIRSVTAVVTDNELTCGDWGYLPMDYDENCYVDLRDYAVFASYWLDVTIP